MSTIKFRWTVDELDNVRSLFTVHRVWRTASIVAPVMWTEITNPVTRVPLVAGVASYYFDDIAGAAGSYYAVTYYNPATLLESERSAPVRVDSLGYISVADVRDEGFTVAMATDAQVAKAIQIATALVDRYTRRWFEPRTRTFRIDGKTGSDMLLDIPIIRIDTLTMWEEPLNIAEMWIYNRHLTQGLLTPDDRDNPRIAWRDEVISLLRRQFVGLRKWDKAHGNIVVTGVFGYTDLDPLDTPGETVAGSQIPVSFGACPALIKRACLLLAIRHMYGLATGRGEDWRNRGRVISETTRDQSYSLAAPGVDGSWGISGDVEVDNILMMYAAPMACGVV